MSNQRTFLLVAFFAASIALGVPPNLSDTFPTNSFCVWTDSLWMRVAQSRMIVVASARRMQGDEAPRYQLNVKEVLKGEANVEELILQLRDYYNDEVNAQVLDGAGGNPVILHLSFTSDTGRIGNSSVCYSIPSIYGAAESFTMEKAAAICAEVAHQRRQLDEFGSRVKTDQLPHWAEVTNLTAQLTLGPTAQQEAVTKIRGNISRLFPALIAAMDDNANLAKEFLVLPNFSPDWFEQFRRYGPKKVVDLVAALLAEATSVPFGDLFNGASEETRRHVVNGWRVLLLHWLDASDGGYDLQPLAILRAFPVRDAIDMKQDGNESPVGNHSRTNTIIGTTGKTHESANPIRASRQAAMTILCFDSEEMKTTSTTFANQLDGGTAQPGRARSFASAPTCSLSQVVWVVSNSVFVIDDHLEFLSFSLSGTLDGAGGLSRYGAISRRAAKGAEPQRRGKRRRFFNTKITENTKNTKNTKC